MNPLASKEQMLHQHLQDRGIRDLRVLDAFQAIQREDFLPEQERGLAYDDTSLPLPHGQVAAQPYIVARMVELLELPEHAHVLELGAGCGFQTAILAHIARDVCSIEWYPDLATQAARNLLSLGFTHIELIHGDGLLGWPDRSRKFDGIVLAFAVDEIPQVLFDSLVPSGRLVAPLEVGDHQTLRVFQLDEHGDVQTHDEEIVHFVHGKTHATPGSE
ncbi:protein-L-isoaspartate(D-aspartate) O-methyltransferase [Haloferula luteola]|uniref:Protein-L-isoaspartate O-methyltransferase n=1 Tax=Haloferula luteola TaxID=595692 RepID=A0A840VBK9_9BACT|nr:protein-L-isoaspartate O-methyltransferase [Haloferula luteola]MBB5351320.1 protein-L-isoaspartate(D-aspartate) O-methyltransferase [Haloferula luteola]